MCSLVLISVAATGCEPIARQSDEAEGWIRVPLGLVPMPGGGDDVIVIGDEFVVGGYARSGVILLASQDGIAWEDRSNGFEGNEQGTALVSLAASPLGAVGLVGQGPSGSRSMGIRFSEDSWGWRSVDEELFTRITGVVSADVVWTGHEFFAVGARPSGGDDPTAEILVYRSTDGVRWSLERSPLLRLNGPRAPNQVTSWNGSLVVLATSATGGLGTILIRGHDVGDWALMEPPELADANVRAVAGTSAGLLIGGCIVDATGSRAATIWIDSEGTGKSLRPVTLDGESGCVSGISEGSDQILAVGSDRDRAAVWSSSDASAWDRQEPVDAFSGRIGANAVSAAQVGKTWVVVGHDLHAGSNDPPESVAIWRSE